MRTALLVAGGVVVGTMAGLVTMRLLRPSTPEPLRVRSTLDVRPAEQLNTGGIDEDQEPLVGDVCHYTINWLSAILAGLLQ